MSRLHWNEEVPLLPRMMYLLMWLSAAVVVVVAVVVLYAARLDYESEGKI